MPANQQSTNTASPIIGLLTDFGTQDGFTGIMKAVMAGISPNSRIIDISHDIRPQHIQEGAFTLWNAYHYFPKGSVLLGVVDPGVGSERKVLVAKTDRHTFVAPDNGLLDQVLHEQDDYQVFEATDTRYFRKDVSHTFHGRDIFAPLAAHLANGLSPEKVGPAYNYTPKQAIPIINVKEKGTYHGQVLHTDRFGNLITNLRPAAGLPLEQARIEAGSQRIHGICKCYASAKKGEILLLINSCPLLEIAVREGHAAKKIGMQTGDAIKLVI